MLFFSLLRGFAVCDLCVTAPELGYGAFKETEGLIFVGLCRKRAYFCINILYYTILVVLEISALLCWSFPWEQPRVPPGCSR